MLFGFQVFSTGMIYGFIDSLTRGLQAAARDRGCNLLLSCGMNLIKPHAIRPAWPIPAPNVDFVPVGPWNTDGLIIVHSLLSLDRALYARELKASGFPVVFVGTAEGGPAIGVANDVGIHQAVRHLFEHGHRRIAFIAGFPTDDRGDSGERLQAFESAMREFGLEFDPRLIAYGQHQVAEGQQAMQSILECGAPFTAVVASNDESARGAIEALTEAGREVPRDVAVIGFDDRPDGTYKLPPLTTIHHPIFERGYRAMEMLLDRLEGRRPPDERIVKLPTRLVVRRTCGCTLENILADAAPNAPVEKPSVRAQLARIMAQAILAETHHLTAGEIYQLARRIVDALAASVDRQDPVEFLTALQAVLARVEQIDSSTAAWRQALAAAESAPQWQELVGGATAFASQLMARAQDVVAAAVKRQYWHGRETVIEETSLLSARLLTALEEPEILRILSEHLPRLDIPQAAVVLFDADGDDTVGWSTMRTSLYPDAEPVRFRSREFPPPGFASARDTRYSLALVPLSQQGINGYMVFDTDNLDLCATITHTVNTALKAARMYRDAVEGRRLAEEANQLKSRFLSTVGHELRTPLSLILANSELLLSGKGPRGDDNMQNIAGIRASAQQLDGLIRDVLDLTRNELGKLSLACEALDVSAALEPVSVFGQQLARAKGLKWRVLIARQLPRVWADRTRVRQVTLNLITNAVKFTATGEVTLRVDSDGRSVTISVRDTGLGIPPEERETIFDDFRQSTRTMTRDYGGLGLGLAICKRLVEMHAGTITVLSEGTSGQGSRFDVNLPALDIGLKAVEKTALRAQPVLLLDDGGLAATALQAALEQKGVAVERLRVDALATGLDTLAIAPSTVLIEVSDTLRDHAPLLAQLRAHASTHDAAISFYSLRDRRQSGAIQVLNYLTKPVGSAELAQALHQHGISSDRGGHTILVADDDPGLLEMHARVVQTLGPDYRILKARNGKTALALIRKHHPDLVLLDLVMPHMDGFEVLEEMQKLETTRDIPVIVLTGQNLADEEMERLGRSVATVLGKGIFTVEETLTHVRRTLSREQAPKTDAQRVVRKAMAYLHQHYQDAITRKDIARHARVSEDYLTHCFQHHLHMPPMTYLSRYRVNRAKSLLTSGDLSITQVASAVGFSDQFHFNRVFRRETGVAPSVYRRGGRATS